MGLAGDLTPLAGVLIREKTGDLRWIHNGDIDVKMQAENGMLLPVHGVPQVASGQQGLR